MSHVPVKPPLDFNNSLKIEYCHANLRNMATRTITTSSRAHNRADPRIPLSIQGRPFLTALEDNENAAPWVPSQAYPGHRGPDLARNTMKFI